MEFEAQGRMYLPIMYKDISFFEGEGTIFSIEGGLFDTFLGMTPKYLSRWG